VSVTARDLLRLLAHQEINLDSQIWVGCSAPGLHEATRAWVDENGLHVTDEDPA
jgi:hypothetical protein